MQDIKEGYVRVETHRGITIIEFFHPQSNALTYKIMSDLAKEIHFAGTHDESKVIVLKSSGDKTFCSGISFDELKSLKTEHEAIKLFGVLAELINAIRKCPKFIIGRIHGKCIGAGVGLVAALDYSIAIDNAEIKLNELLLGIGPFVIGPVIEKKTGASSLSTLTINATIWRTAEWARKKGLYAEVHQDESNLDEAVSHLANHLSRCNLPAMTMLKKNFWKGCETWDELLKERASISGKLAISDFTKKALEKFINRQGS